MKIFITIFLTVFLAELGDKTQLATMLFASDAKVSKWTVFLAASAALVVAAGIGVVAGELLGKVISERTLSILAGVGFVLIGAFLLWGALRQGA